jgi:hypothetical protein
VQGRDPVHQRFYGRTHTTLTIWAANADEVAKKPVERIALDPPPAQFDYFAARFTKNAVEIDNHHVFDPDGVARVNRTTPASFCVS